MAIKESSGSERREECYRTQHGGSATLWISTAQRDWLFSYSQFLYIEWDPSEGLIIYFSTHQIKITGLNLNPIVDALSNLELSHLTQPFEDKYCKADSRPRISTVKVTRTED